MEWARFLGFKAFFIKMVFLLKAGTSWNGCYYYHALVFGFGQFFIQVVEALYLDYLACLYANQFKCEEVSLFISIRP